jgi:predicted NAD-dependent protein-ADP-ribosyltransferase YbiA (DUF1768 family)
MPYTMKLLDQETTTFGNFGFRLLTESNIHRLREEGWAWPSVDVEFQAGDRGVEAASQVNQEAAAAATAAATEAKPARKKGAAAAVAAPPRPPTAGEDSKEAGADDMIIGEKLDNKFKGFANSAMIAFRVIEKQVPGPDGTVYPEIGVAANGSVDTVKQTWPSVDHYMAAMKFPTDPAWQEAIRQAPSALRARVMGADAGHPARADYDQIRRRLLRIAMESKIRQNPELLALLRAYSDKGIFYKSTDKFLKQGGDGENAFASTLADIRDSGLAADRYDVRFFAAAAAAPPPPPPPSPPAPPGPGPEEEAANQLEEGAEQIASAVQKGGALGQTGGVYLFINSGASVEGKARRAREPGKNRQLSWDGMAVSKMGEEGQVGGGASAGGEEQMTTESGASLEVSVQKLDS